MESIDGEIWTQTLSASEMRMAELIMEGGLGLVASQRAIGRGNESKKWAKGGADESCSGSSRLDLHGRIRTPSNRLDNSNAQIRLRSSSRDSAFGFLSTARSVSYNPGSWCTCPSLSYSRTLPAIQDSSHQLSISHPRTFSTSRTH